MDVIDTGTFMPGDILDPETMEQISRDIQNAVDAQVEYMTTPMYPRWYKDKDYPKPDLAKAFNVAKKLEGEFGQLRTQVREDFRTLGGETFGAFKGDFDPDEDDGWVDSGIRSEVEMIAYQLADADVSYDAPATTMSDEEEAERKIDFAIACNEDAKRQHGASGHGSVQLDEARTLLTTGRMAWHVTLNLDAEEGEMPFNETLLDPLTCYPVFENKRGLKIMARSYTTTVADAVGAFTSEENDLTYLYDKRGKGGKFQQSKNETDSCNITEYWDRKWRIVWMDGNVILGPIPHDYGFVPFVYKLGGLGLPGFMSEPTTVASHQMASITTGYSWNPRDVSNPSKGISLIRLLRAPHMLREAVYTKLLKAFDLSIHPPMTVELDDLTYPMGAPEVDMSRNALNAIKMGRQNLSPMPVTPSPQMMNPILSGAQENTGRLMLPPTAHGQNDHSNVAGYATNVLNEAGLVKLVPHKKVLEEFKAEQMEMRFRMYRDWGHLVQQGPYGRQGEITVPRADVAPNEARAFTLTPKDLRDSGVRIKTSMSTVSIQMLGVIGNSVNMWTQAGLMDEVTALKLRQDPNPYRTLKRVRMDQLMKDPIVQEMRAIEALREAGMDREAEYFAMRKQGPAAGAGGAPPPQGGGGSPVGTVVGDSNAQYGLGPGPGSGPQGPLGPRGPVGME